MDIELLKTRAQIIRNTRRFFDMRGYLEVDTPLLSPDLIPETCLEVFKTEYISPFAAQRNSELYLIPSPEIWMKKLIARYKTNAYQICKCFRNCESLGKTHSPEFTMLEYYTMDADYLDSLALTEQLLDTLLDDTDLLQFQNKKELDALRPPFIRLTMNEAFKQYAGFSLTTAIAEHSLARYARELGLAPPPDTCEADLYNLIFIHTVEPQLRGKRPVALLDYPAIVNCLAALNKEEDEAAATRQRWELYINGLETANCYSEETQAEKVKRYFESEGAAKVQTARVFHHIDKDYQQLFQSFPHCSGAALGIDRLIMALTGRQTIDAVLPFGATAC